SHISGRTAIKEHRRIRRQPEFAVCFGQEASDCQEIAQNAHSALRRLAAFSQGLGCRMPFGDGCEEIQIDRAFERLRQMECVDAPEEKLRGWLGRLCGHEFTSEVVELLIKMTTELSTFDKT